VQELNFALLYSGGFTNSDDYDGDVQELDAYYEEYQCASKGIFSTNYVVTIEW